MSGNLQFCVNHPIEAMDGKPVDGCRVEWARIPDATPEKVWYAQRIVSRPCVKCQARKIGLAAAIVVSALKQDPPQ